MNLEQSMQQTVSIPDPSDDCVLRHVKVGPVRLLLWDTYIVDDTHHTMCGYAMWVGDCAKSTCDDPPLFFGTDYGVSSHQPVDSDDAVLGILSFLTLAPGDTDADFFAQYTEEQLEWCQSSECEQIALEVSVAEDEEESVPDGFIEDIEAEDAD